ECWYILQAEEGAEIVFGHHAKSTEELEKMAKAGEWDDLLRRVPVKAGDYVYVPSGTIQAICTGIVLLETQQSSDITNRVYDYDRTDEQVKPSELLLDSSIKLTTTPHLLPSFNQTVSNVAGLIAKKLIEEQYFTVYHWDLDGETNQTRHADFVQIS